MIWVAKDCWLIERLGAPITRKTFFLKPLIHSHLPSTFHLRFPLLFSYSFLSSLQDTAYPFLSPTAGLVPISPPPWRSNSMLAMTEPGDIRERCGALQDEEIVVLEVSTDCPFTRPFVY